MGNVKDDLYEAALYQIVEGIEAQSMTQNHAFNMWVRQS